MLTRRELILIKVESTYNTDSVPVAATDALQVIAPSWANEGARMLDRQNIHPGLHTDKKIFGGTLRSISFGAEIKGSGAAGTPPEIAAALLACGLAETVVASTSVTYDPASTLHDSVTVYYFQDGKRRILTGVRGTLNINLTAGEYGMANFVLTGHVQADVDIALPAGTFDATEPEALIGIPFDLGGFAAVINSLEFSMGNEIAQPSSLSASDGFGEIRIAGRDVSGSFDPEDVLLATEDFLADWRVGTEFALDTGAVGATAGNIYRITQPAIAYREMAPGERDGIRTFDIGFGAGISSGDDEVAIAFT